MRNPTLCICFLLSLLLAPGTSLAWREKGHQIVGELAERNPRIARAGRRALAL